MAARQPSHDRVPCVAHTLWKAGPSHSEDPRYLKSPQVEGPSLTLAVLWEPLRVRRIGGQYVCDERDAERVNVYSIALSCRSFDAKFIDRYLGFSFAWRRRGHGAARRGYSERVN